MTDPYESSGRTAVAEQPQAVVADRKKPVLVTGASGLVGTHACRELVKRGWKIRALVRDPVKAAGRLAHMPVELRFADLRDLDAVREVMRGVGAVVHLAAIAIEGRGQNYEAVNTEATRLLLSAAAEAKVDRFIYMSQNGASSRSPFRFLRSKGLAEDAVRESGMPWTVLRPSVIFGPEDAFVGVLARLIRLTPLVLPLPGGGAARFQPVAVDDVARVIAMALDKPAAVGQVYPLGGATPLTLRQMSERILLALDARRLIVGIPVALLRPVTALMARVLPHPPVTPSLLDLLAVDNTVRDNAIWETFGLTPVPFAPEELMYLRRITLLDALRQLLGGA